MEKTKTLALIILLAFLLRAQPVFLQGYSDPDTFFHQRNIETIVSTHQAFFWDSLSQQGRYYSNFPLFHLPIALAEINTGLPIELLMILFPALFSTAIILFIFLLAKRFFSERTALFAAFALAIMPLSIIRANGTARPDALAMLFLLCCLFALLSNKKKTALFFAVAVAFTNPVPTSGVLLGIIFVASVVLWLKKQKSFFMFIMFAALFSVLAFLLWTMHFPFGFEYYYSNVAMGANELQQTDPTWILASLKFSWLFILFGFFAAWKKNWFFSAWLLSCFAIAFVAPRMALFFALPAAVFSGIGLQNFESKTKQYSKIFFVLLFVLAALNIFPEAYNSRPYLLAEEKAGIGWLSANAPSDTNIAGEWDFGDPLAALTNRPVLMDGHFEFNPAVAQRYKDNVQLMQSIDCNETSAIIEKYKINYFFADHESLWVDYNCNFASRLLDANRAIVFGFN